MGNGGAGRAGGGGQHGNGGVLKGGSDSPGRVRGGREPMGQRRKGAFTSRRDLARCSGPGVGARRRELGAPGWRALAEEEREEGKKKNKYISKSEK